MGGAARNEKRRKQQDAARKPASAGIKVSRKSGPNRTSLILVAIVVAFAMLVGGFVLWSRTSTEEPVASNYPVTVSGAVVTAGTGPVAIDVYEDYLCPVCERFEENYGTDIKTALNDGKITVRYHSTAILDRMTNPVGYSTRAANAALCAADASIYPAYHEKLFDEQPVEGSSGLTDDQLVAFGTEFGAGPDFAACVTDGTYSAQVAAETAAAASDPNLQTNGQFGTPTVTIDNTKTDLTDGDWLQNAVAAG